MMLPAKAMGRLMCVSWKSIRNVAQYTVDLRKQQQKEQETTKVLEVTPISTTSKMAPKKLIRQRKLIKVDKTDKEEDIELLSMIPSTSATQYASLPQITVIPEEETSEENKSTTCKKESSLDEEGEQIKKSVPKLKRQSSVRGWF
jgi:hypothetical protein